MNRTRVMTLVCSLACAALLGGCGGGGSSSGSVGGTVTGLAAGTSVSLAMNGGTPIQINANGGFTFSGGLASGAGYNVVVTSQPAGQTCLVNYGSGVIDYSGNSVTNVAVECSANVSIGAVASGLASGDKVTFTMTLQNDPSRAYSVTATTAGVTNTFPVLLPLGTIYNVAVSAQPSSPAQVCTFSSTSPSPYSGGVVGSAAIVVKFDCN